MAKERTMFVEALPSVYSKKKIKSNRTLEIKYSIPSNGINEDTGFCMYIAGFRGHSNTNIAKKMRRVFADEYNLVAIQCDYFGNKFMQKPKKLMPQNKHMEYFTKEELIKIYKRGSFNIENFFEICEKYELKMKLREDLSEENEDEFNEMGLMQAMDNITALLAVMQSLADNGEVFNSKKVILHGNSHGAYLCHLCNILAPNLVSLIIDNSGWIYPEHIKEDRRSLNMELGKTKIKVVFDYKARHIIDDHEIINLSNLYSQYKNRATVVAYHGEKDTLITLEDKRKFCETLPNTTFNEVNSDTLQSYIDKEMFKNTKHGMGANFINLVDYVLNNLDFQFEKSTEFKRPENQYLESEKYRYIFTYDTDIPSFVKCKK